MKKILSIVAITLIIFACFSVSTSIYALSDPTDNPDTYKPQSQSDIDSKASKYAGLVYGTLQNTGVVVGTVMMAVIGLKYIVGSAEEKAEYKQTMVPFFIGALLLTSVSVILGLIQDAMEG